MPEQLVTSSENRYTKQLRRLINELLTGNRSEPSLALQATQFFRDEASQQAHAEQLLQHVSALEQQASQTRKADPLRQQELQQAKQRYADFEYKQQQSRQLRYNKLHLICEQLLELTEGNNSAETILRSSRMLGTIQLMAPSEGDSAYILQQKYKPFYKAVLSLRLLDHLLQRNLITNSYILRKYQQQQELLQIESKPAYQPFRDDVQLPLLMAVLLQDLGHYHPDALLMLQTEGLHPNYRRQFSPPQRQAFVELTQQASLHYLLQGIGMPQYRGNSRTERDTYQQREQEKLAFTATLLKASLEPGSGVGNLLRLPQVYASAVLPGRARYVYETLPKVALILKNGARQGQYDERMVDQLLTITGIFPQGYGIVYLPLDQHGAPAERYEFAIVNSLYPPSPETPLCRSVTRAMRYRTSGPNLAISIAQNLYFKPARQQLNQVPAQRLQEILGKLSADFEPAQLRKFLPRCWHPDQFFADPKHQNLWNKAEVQAN